MLTTTLLLLTLSGTPVAFNEPPPPPPVEQVAPRAGWVWVEGGYVWRYGRYRRLPGHWERARADRRWRSGRWFWRGDHYEWIPGGWVVAVPPPPRARWGYPGISIMGRVVDRWGRPVPGVSIVLAGTSEARVLTDGDGRYAFTGLQPGSYAVRPTEPRCGFGPDVINLNNLGTNAVQNFTANCR